MSRVCDDDDKDIDEDDSFSDDDDDEDRKESTANDDKECGSIKQRATRASDELITSLKRASRLRQVRNRFFNQEGRAS